MHTQQISPVSAETNIPTRHDEHEYGIISHPDREHPIHTDTLSEVPEHSHKKPVLDVVKDKVKKLKSKIKRHKHGDNEESNDVSSGEEEEIESPLNHTHQAAEQFGGNGQGTPVTIHPIGEASLIPDPNVVSVGSGIGVHEAFGKPSLGDSKQLQEQVPSAAGYDSAGVTPYLAAHGFGGKIPEQPQISPETKPGVSSEQEAKAATEKVYGDEHKEVSKNIGTSAELSQHMGETEKQGKSERGHVNEGIEAGAEAKEEGTHEAKEKICSSNKPLEPMAVERKPMVTRAADTMISFKDALASKFGYGPKSSPKKLGEPINEASPMEIDVNDGEKSPDINPSGDKSYAEKLHETGNQAKDTVVSGMHVVQETVIEAKDALASKAGLHGSKEESHIGESTNVEKDSRNIAQDSGEKYSATAGRFHPGDEDRALSQLITEKLSLGATALKDTLMKPFGTFKSKSSTPTDTTQPPTKLHAGSEEEKLGTEGSEKEQGVLGKASEVVSSMIAPTHAGSEEEKHGIEGGEKEQGVLGKASEVVSSMIAPITGSRIEGEEEKQGRELGDTEQKGVIEKASEAISSLLTPHIESEEKHSTKLGSEEEQGEIGKSSGMVSSVGSEEKQPTESGGGQGVIGKASEMISSMIGETHAGSEEKQATESGSEKEQQGMIGKATEMISSMLGKTPQTEKELESTSKADESGVCSVEMH